MSTESNRPPEDGFEHDGEFYRWSVSDTGKDLMLIDRFTGMPIHEFFEIIEDDFDRGRAPILLALIATSIRAAHPDWSVERIARVVTGLSLSAVTFVDADKEESELPPSSAGQPEPASTGEKPSNESSPSPTPQDNSPSETSSVPPA